MDRCQQFSKILLTKVGYKRKDISVVSCCGGWFVETPKTKKEVSAHCKWCAVAEVVAGEV